MNNKQYGLSKEREAKELLLKRGALAVERQRGSFGVFDITAYFPEFCLKVSVKATKQKYVSFKREIEKIRQVLMPDYCKRALWIYWSPNKGREKRGWEEINIEQKKI